jgi:hypothetical protein
MSDALDRLRQARPDGRTITGRCVCGDPLEVALAVQIRERGSPNKALVTKTRRFCANCAVERMEKAMEGVK